MAPIGETATSDAGGATGALEEAGAAGGAGAKKGSYVPPALRGDRAAGGAAGERMGGSKYGERDDLATLRVTNVRYLTLIVLMERVAACCHRVEKTGTNCDDRYQKWLRRESCGRCLSASDVSPECSWLRTGKRVWPRALLSSVLQIVGTLSRPATRWTDMVSSILFSGSSLPRRLSRLLVWS